MFKRVRIWFLATVLMLIASIGGIASNWLTADLQNALESYRPWVWGVFGLALLVTVIMAIRKWQAVLDEAP